MAGEAEVKKKKNVHTHSYALFHACIFFLPFLLPPSSYSSTTLLLGVSIFYLHSASVWSKYCSSILANGINSCRRTDLLNFGDWFVRAYQVEPVIWNRRYTSNFFLLIFHFQFFRFSSHFFWMRKSVVNVHRSGHRRRACELI